MPTNDNQLSKDQEQARKNELLFAQYREQLKSNEKFKQYASQFSTYSVEQFLNDFANKKVMWAQWGKKKGEWRENDEIKWQEKTIHLLKQIQQKKLFDLQCQWRAELVTLPKIEISDDFTIWEGDIFACPFLPAVTEDEADLFYDYLKSPGYQHVQGFRGWQNYEAIKEAYDNQNAYPAYPEWYSTYDSRFGTSRHLLLPDIRGEKERFYIELADNEDGKKAPAKPANKATQAATPAAKPRLNYFDNDFLDFFVKKYDTPEVYKYFKAFEYSSKSNDEEVNELVEILSQSEEPVPISKSNNWVHGLHQAAAEFERRQCIELFPSAYDEYRIFFDNNIERIETMSFLRLQMALESLQVNIKKHKIKRGRELNGESPDFDF